MVNITDNIIKYKSTLSNIENINYRINENEKQIKILEDDNKNYNLDLSKYKEDEELLRL
jgi:hypothetical protein